MLQLYNCTKTTKLCSSCLAIYLFIGINAIAMYITSAAGINSSNAMSLVSLEVA